MLGTWNISLAFNSPLFTRHLLMPKEVHPRSSTRLRFTWIKTDFNSYGPEIGNKTSYWSPNFRSLIGKLLYITHFCPVICFNVCRLSQRLSNPTEEHLNAAFRILKHLKKEPTTGLLFQKYSNLTITRFSDSDWGAFKETCRSTTRFCFYLGSSLVSWKSKMQQIVFRSSPEAEYRVVANASCEA